MEKILIIDNYDSFTYNLVQYVEANQNFEVDVYRNDEITIEEVAKYNIIILSPGPGLPKDAGILKELIERYASTKKILGVCLGMQAIGEVYGGLLINLSEVFHGVATPIVVLEKENLLFKGFPNSFNVGRYHSWVISKDDFPDVLKIISTDNNGQIMAIKHKEYNVYGVQFHPESILTENGKEIINNFLSIWNERNTLDLNAIPILKEKSHLPVIVDPSHGIGLRQHFAIMALASVMAGADGVIIEVHEDPEKAFSDGQQTLYHKQVENLYGRLRATKKIAAIV